MLFVVENMNNTKIIYKEESFAIQGAVFEVYREMGHGFLESVYQECMERELKDRNVPFDAQPELQLLEPIAKVKLICTPAPFPSFPFPRWGQGKLLRHCIILPPPGEGCP